jgi:hypothetical protein
MPLDRTRSLIAELATALGLEAIPPDAGGGYQLTVGGTTQVLIYGGNDQTVLIVAPLGPLPRRPGYGLVVYLLRNNMFNSDLVPFRIAIDEAGGLIVWGKARVEELTGGRLAGLIGVLAERVGAIRQAIEEDGD